LWPYLRGGGSPHAFTPLAPWLGFTPLPPLFFAILVLMIVTYLALVEGVKRWFYRASPM